VWVGYEHWHSSGGHPIAWRDRSAELRGARFSKAVARTFRDRAELERFLAELPGKPVQPPAVDFNRDLALLVAAGPRSSTGYAVTIVGAKEERGRVAVEVRERTPSLRDRVRARVTYPYVFVSLPQTAKPVHVDWLGRP
jgi:PrcB C-terminal